MSNDLIDGLRSPSAYGHEIAGEVEVAETHLSWVLLTGQFAYKVLKPVRFDFVDYGTLERRRAACEEEIRLNRRLAPGIYLGVAPIYGTPAAPTFREGEGEPIEYAVRMRQFDQDGLLARLLERGEVAPKQIGRLARRVARFQESAEVARPDGPYGTPEAVHRPTLDNFDALEESGIPADWRAEVTRLREWAEVTFGRRRELMAERLMGGFVREGHGDLHAGNIAIEGDEVIIFDALEFSPELRWIDVINEVAFPLMDLEARGRADLARRFLDAWLEATGDFAGLPLLPYFLGYRAMVRAKVAALRLGQGGLSGEEREHQRGEVAGHLALAARHAESPSRPQIFITHGVSGSGKSRGSRALVEALGMVRVRSDVERKRLMGVDPRAAAPADAYAPEVTERAYGRLAEAVRPILDAGYPAVVDATFLARGRRDRFRQLAEELGARFRILDFRAGEEALRARVAGRKPEGNNPSDADLGVLERQLATREPLNAAELAESIPVETEDPEAFPRLIAALREA